MTDSELKLTLAMVVLFLPLLAAGRLREMVSHRRQPRQIKARAEKRLSKTEKNFL
jgi:hypothetical protein